MPLLRDTERKMYVDPDKVHDIQHKGKYFTVPGAHLCEPSPQRTPVIFQAGLSPKGSAFAAEHAEGVYVSMPTTDIARKFVDKIRGQADAVWKKRRRHQSV